MARKRRSPNRPKDAKEGGVNPAPVAHISDPSGLDPNMGQGQRRFYSKPKPAAPAQIEKADPADLYAALDLGTNSCRMLIAQPKGTHLHIVDSFSKSVQLGQGLEASGRLSRASMARAIGALKICQRKPAQHQVRRMRIVATEACRRATNRGEFLNLVKRETGLQMEIIKPEEEAQLAVISCAPLVSSKTEQLLVVDIGGGSTELVWIDLSRVASSERARAIMRLHQGFGHEETIFPRAKVVDWISVPLGVATLKDLYHDVEDDGARFALMSWYFEEQLAKFSPYVDAADQAREGFQIIGTSGTVTTVAASHLGLKRYDRNKVDGLRMTSDQIDTVIQTYLALGPDGRRNDPRIGRDRHSLIMSGSAILQALLRAWPTDRLSVADRGLREGLLYAQMCRDGVMEDGLL
jgi:exopolyphosphatase/guanosine-5'-triphosphate,3'-diphosphate pyrophosphatase